ncbi:hypothetical protein LIER_32710 [Lithospermum erythrorhizon]|uniref:Uncharacterized protein n=1 Tax=Lithospermum erythrorhizon TaxID=34254 RepID=A0AAV3RVY6_LITER
MKSKGIRKIFRSSKSSKSIEHDDLLHHGATTKWKRCSEPKETDLIFTNNGDKDRFFYALKSIFGCSSQRKVGIKKSKEKMPQKLSSKVFNNWKSRLKESNMDQIESDSSKSIFTSSTNSNSSTFSRASSMASSSNSSWSIELKHGSTSLKKNKASGCYFGTELGICLILVGLLVLLIWGKLIAIGCSSFGLLLVFLLNQNYFIIVKK